MFLNFKNLYKSEFHVYLNTSLNSMCTFKRKWKLILTGRKVKSSRKTKTYLIVIRLCVYTFSLYVYTFSVSVYTFSQYVFLWITHRWKGNWQAVASLHRSPSSLEVIHAPLCINHQDMSHQPITASYPSQRPHGNETSHRNRCRSSRSRWYVASACLR